MADSSHYEAPKLSIPPVDKDRDESKVITEISEQGTVVDLLRAVDSLSFSSTMTMAAVVEKLETRKRDLEELVSIAKSGQELQRKIERLAARLLREERGGVG